jgi:hypothetical protein
MSSFSAVSNLAHALKVSDGRLVSSIPRLDGRKKKRSDKWVKENDPGIVVTFR